MWKSEGRVCTRHTKMIIIDEVYEKGQSWKRNGRRHGFLNVYERVSFRCGTTNRSFEHSFCIHSLTNFLSLILVRTHTHIESECLFVCPFFSRLSVGFVISN